MGTNRYLLVSRIGPDSLHDSWIGSAADRNFDIFLSCYDPNVPVVAGDGVSFEYRPGRKVSGYAGFLRDHAVLLRGYDHIALFDDDLQIGAAAISRLFSIAAEHDLKIAQPALTHDSHFTYGCLLRHAPFKLRFVNYVEMMCPIFRTDILLAVAPLFDMGYESGIDLIWCNLVAETPHDFAVIDAVPIRHTQRVGARKAANGFAGGMRYEDHIHAILARFDIPWLPCLPFGAIRRDGRHAPRSAFALPAAKLATAIMKQPPIRMRARNIAVYWKHLLQARPRNIRIIL